MPKFILKKPYTVTFSGWREEVLEVVVLTADRAEAERVVAFLNTEDVIEDDNNDRERTVVDSETEYDSDAEGDYELGGETDRDPDYTAGEILNGE